jgi:group II intron reverse transcriptase/maturase
MNGRGKSDSPVVPTKFPNKEVPEPSASYGEPQTGTKGETPETAKGEPTASSEAREPTAEGTEGRGLAEGNLREQNVPRTQNREVGTTSALERVGGVARRDKQVRFTTLLHHVYNTETLRGAYLGLKREAAPGVDGVTWREYGEQLEAKLEDLSLRLKRGAYRAKPVRRVQIPKPDGRQRPLGVTALEDKVVQRALVEVLEQIYEADFLGFSYGFRPGRGQHDALDALSVGITEKKVHWVLDMDIRDFFGTIDHGWLVRFVEQRVADRRIVRLIQKWLRAGVLEDGMRKDTEEGTPQGGVVSPLLANIYLHYVFDLWARHWRRQANGDVIIVRYADDIVVGFQKEAEARRFWADVAEQFAKYGLELNSEKTRLLNFGRRAAARGRRNGRGKPETFDFLGFTHICGRSRGGRFQLLRRTSRKRMQRKLNEVKAELRRRLHRPVPEVGRWLRSVLQGHFNYYGVPLNSAALCNFRYEVIRRWRFALARRSQKGRVTWARVSRLASLWLPPARITHPYPSERLCLTT